MKRVLCSALVRLLPVLVPAAVLPSCVMSLPGLGNIIFTSNDSDSDIEDALEELDD